MWKACKFIATVACCDTVTIILQMDPHFDPSKSSTSTVKQCGGKGQKCFFRQSYSEGSSWHAFKVSDQVYIGGKTPLTYIS